MFFLVDFVELLLKFKKLLYLYYERISEFRDSFCFFYALTKSIMGVMYLTEEGLSKLKSDIEKLTKVERPAISKQIADARDKGDLSENAEYHAAKEAQGMLEMKISRLRESLANSRLVDKNKIDTTNVQLMNKVKIKNKANNQVMEYFLVAEAEANLKEGKIAITSPIAKGLLGKKVGDVVDVQVPSGTIRFEIMGISL